MASTITECHRPSDCTWWPKTPSSTSTKLRWTLHTLNNERRHRKRSAHSTNDSYVQIFERKSQKFIPTTTILKQNSTRDVAGVNDEHRMGGKGHCNTKPLQLISLWYSIPPLHEFHCEPAHTLIQRHASSKSKWPESKYHSSIIV